jgi:hypothetical protein
MQYIYIYIYIYIYDLGGDVSPIHLAADRVHLGEAEAQAGRVAGREPLHDGHAAAHLIYIFIHTIVICIYSYSHSYINTVMRGAELFLGILNTRSIIMYVYIYIYTYAFID